MFKVQVGLLYFTVYLFIFLLLFFFTFNLFFLVGGKNVANTSPATMPVNFRIYCYPLSCKNFGLFCSCTCLWTWEKGTNESYKAFHTLFVTLKWLGSICLNDLALLQGIFIVSDHNARSTWHLLLGEFLESWITWLAPLLHETGIDTIMKQRIVLGIVYVLEWPSLSLSLL